MKKESSKESSLIVDGTIGQLNEQLKYVNVNLTASNDALEFLTDHLQRAIAGDERQAFILTPSYLDDGVVIAVDPFTDEEYLSFEHIELYKYLEENVDKRLIGNINKLEFKDDNVNAPIIQIYFCVFDRKENEFDDDSILNEDDFEENDNNEDDEIKTYSIEDVWVKGYTHLTDYQKDYVLKKVNVGDRVYLRNEFENQVDKNALLVLHQGTKIGYVQAHKAEFILGLLRQGKIGFIEISSIDKDDESNVYVNIDVYYEDIYGTEELPYYPLEGRPISVLQTDLWTYQEDYFDDWYLCLATDQLCYMFRDEFAPNHSDFKEVVSHIIIDFDLFIRKYLDGTGITRDSLEKFFILSKEDWEKEVLKKWVESYMEYMDYKFID